MTDLITFLRAQLDDEAAHAEECRRVEGAVSFVTGVNGTSRRWPDPSRVLAEVEAKRRILDAWDWAGGWVTFGNWDSCSDSCPGEVMWNVARLLALPFSDRPGYDETWRP